MYKYIQFYLGFFSNNAFWNRICLSTTTHNSLISSIWGFTFYLTSKDLITNIRIELWFVFLQWFMIVFKQCLDLIEPLMSWFLSLRIRLIFSKIPPLEQVFLVFLNFCSLQVRQAMDVWGHVETWGSIEVLVCVNSWLAIWMQFIMWWQRSIKIKNLV